MTESLYEFVERVFVPGAETLERNEKRCDFVHEAYKRMRERCAGSSMDVPDIVTFANARGVYSCAAFAWKKGDVVKSVPSVGGKYGIVESIDPRSGIWDFGVLVKHAGSEEYYAHDAIEKSDIPAEMLELAMSELKKKCPILGGRDA